VVKLIRLTGRREPGRPIADANLSGYLPGLLDHNAKSAFNFIRPNSISNSNRQIMKNKSWSFAFVFLFFAAFLLPAPTVGAQDADNKPLTLAATQSAKQKHARVCRARYRDCLSKNQIPAFECQYIYQDCLNHMI
jgi:hypothetical protein